MVRTKSGPNAANERLQQQIADDPDDARAHYRLAVLLLASRDLYQFYAPDEAGILDRAARLLERAVQLEPRSADSQAALGFTYHQIGKKLDRALACFRTARRLDKEDETVDVYVPTILVELELEKQALAEIGRVAKRRKVDLKTLRKQFTEAGWKGDAAMLLDNGFIRARNYLWSRLTDEAESIRNSLERGRKRRLARTALAECAAFQRELAREFRASRVPKELRPLSAAAKRYGIGDDVCRPLLMQRMTRTARARLFKQADSLASAVDRWLNEFPSGKMSVEAAAFMYLMSGIDEIR